MSGADAQDPRNLIKLFEQIKGRKATPEEGRRIRARENRQRQGR